MKGSKVDEIDLSEISEIIIQPDGRIFIFGMTKPLMELVDSLPTKDARIRQRRAYLQNLEMAGDGPQTTNRK